jgi:hypothetical protein
VTFTLVIILALATAVTASQATRRARNEQDAGRALRAAESGVHDFLTRLRMNPSYLTLPGTSEHSYCSNPAAATPSPIEFVADLCGWDDTTPLGWATPDGRTDQSFGDAQFHYEILEVDLKRKSIVMESVGRSTFVESSDASSPINTVYRAVRARIAVPAPTDYLYWSDYELADPSDWTTYPDNVRYGGSQNTSSSCGGTWTPNTENTELRYGWQPVTPEKPERSFLYSDRSYPCFQPSFTSQDVLEGPVHSNDAIRSDGATFRGEFTTANPECTSANEDYPESCLDPVANVATFDWESVNASQPAAVTEWEPQEFVEVLNLDARSSVEGVGCRYIGATRIVFEGDTMRVWSKDTTSPRTGCGEAAQLTSPNGNGAVVPIPEDGLIYVANNPAAGEGSQISAGQIGGPASRKLPLGSTTSTDTTQELAMTHPEKFSGRGNVYVEGTLSGRVTVAAETGIVITGDLLVGDAEADMIGLAAGTSVEVFNPLMLHTETVTVDGYTMEVPKDSFLAEGWPTHYESEPGQFDDRPTEGLTVAAAIFAARGSFRVQNWNAEPLGELFVYGSVAQRFRGVVAEEDAEGDVTAGYAKRYVYDPRFRRERPPHTVFLGEQWGIGWTEEGPVPAHVSEVG